MSGSRMVEKLEARRLLSASAVVVKGVLRVRGDLIAGNTITVDETTSGGATAVSVSVVYVDARGDTKTVQSSFPIAGINEIYIRGGYNGDTVNVGQNSTPAFSINTRIDGIYGSDTMNTAAESDTMNTAGESDTINGGFGSDTISSGDGNDVIHGGWLYDHITVGNGNDKIRGGILADTIIAGDGNDTIVGGHRSDSITAGNGNDLLGGILGRNTLIGGTGADTYYEHKGKKPNDLTPTYTPAKGDQIVTTGREPALPKV